MEADISHLTSGFSYIDHGLREDFREENKADCAPAASTKRVFTRNAPMTMQDINLKTIGVELRFILLELPTYFFQFRV